MNFPIRVRAGTLIIKDESILLVEFNDKNGLHYNLPAGGVEFGESVKEAAKREALEEASVEVEVGELAFVYEYAPHLSDKRYGTQPSLGLMFEARIINGEPRLPNNPDKNQTGVKWLALSELENIVLYPKIQKDILEYVQNKMTNFIEESQLTTYE